MTIRCAIVPALERAIRENPTTSEHPRISTPTRRRCPPDQRQGRVRVPLGEWAYAARLQNAYLSRAPSFWLSAPTA